MKKSKVLVVIPAYNEELNIENTVIDVEKNCEYDYLIVNDCSKDNTLLVCQKNNYNYISLPINYGLASAIQVGFKYAEQNDYDAVVQFDGDGQHSAKYLKKLINRLDNNCDVAVGSRFCNKKRPFTLRMLGSRLISLAIFLKTGKKITDPTSGMRAYGKKTINLLANNMNFPPEPDSLVYFLINKYKVVEVPVEMKERMFGESYLNPIKSIQYMTRMIISIIFVQGFRKEKRK